MPLFSRSVSSPLPLREQIRLDHIPDWANLWGQFATQGPAVLLESAGSLEEAARWIILAGKPEIEFWGLNGMGWLKDGAGLRNTPEDLWEFLDEIAIANTSFEPLPRGLSRAWFGLIGYDYGKHHQIHPPKIDFIKRRSIPDYYFFKPAFVLVFDRQTRECYSYGTDIPPSLTDDQFCLDPFRVHSIKSLMTQKEYENMVRQGQGYIVKGDIYQSNLSQAFQAQWEGGSGNLYKILREVNPGPFMGIFQGHDFTVVSSSPERLIAGKGEWLETRPIAGTRPRGKTSVDDLQMKWELETNPKEQAEHLMLVDLARNDLGRVSNFGTVEVCRFAGIESYSRVHHLVSTVQSVRKQSTGFSGVLKSLFPGGTITGCPKIRCMEIIEELENEPRGFYTGSMGYVAPGPCFDFNILIRSLTLTPDGSLTFHAGAGIVADSDPQKEYMETLYKAEALAQSLGTSFLNS